MKMVNKSVCFILFAALLSAFFSGCASDAGEKRLPGNSPPFSSYRDIPGVTGEEIAAVEAMREQNRTFVYGMLPNTETFLNSDGEMRGYSALLCELLTGLFGIPFTPKHYTWYGMLDGLASGEVDFTGDLTANSERRKTYIMTDIMAQRSIKYFRLADRAPITEILKTRMPRYLLQAKTTVANDVLYYASGTFEPIYFAEYGEGYELLKTGKADALITEGVQEAFFDRYGDVVAEDFFPHIYSPVSFSTQNPKLEPIISVVQKALKGDGIRYFYELYDRGHQEYLKHKLFSRITDEKLRYIRENPVIPIAAEYDNYPVSFYNVRQKEWQGISFDVMKQLEILTGLTFTVVNDENAGFHKLLNMLEAGEVYMASEVVPTADRAGRFIWPKNSFMTERSVLISKLEIPNININRVYSVRIGLSRGTAHAEFFQNWFPNHPHTKIFDSQAAAIDAMMNGEVDMVMSSYSMLLYLTNYQEMPDFKANVLFDNNFISTFGLNKDQVILRDIIDMALELIDSQTISLQWLHKAYDFRLKLAQAQMPWLIGSIALSVCVLILVAVLFVKSRRAGKRLEMVVAKRTHELALQKTTLTTLFDSIPDLIFTKNLDLCFTHCNKAFLEHFGKSMDDLIGKSDAGGLGLPSEMTVWYNEKDRTVIHEGLTLRIEESIPRVDGMNQLYETIKIPLMLNDRAVGILGISRDITMRKEMERKMASTYIYTKKLNGALTKITKSPTISAGILKDAADAVAKEGCNALNAKRIGIWSFTNESESLECISSYEIATRKYTVLNNYDLSMRKEYVKLLKSERLVVMNNPDDCLRIYNTLEGSCDNLCAALDAPIRIDGKLVGVVCVEQVICDEFPERREWLLEEQNFASSLADLMALAISGSERRKARDDAEAASQTKSSFLANMSHEIRTPMNAILGVTEILIQQESLTPEIEEGLDKIYNSCNLLLGIINDILDLSKIEAGKMDIMPVQYKAASLINDSVQLNIMRINSKPIEFELEISEDIPAKLIGDELRIKQILNNLLSNAFKYTDAGKVTLSVASEPGPDEGGVTLVLKVRDTGHGMSRDQIAKMFDEYSRFNRKKGSTIEGTGLGLAITQRLLRLMDGRIHVESEPDGGSLFVVWLPQRTVDGETLGREVAANLRQFRMHYTTQRKGSQIVRDPMPYGNVLLVDDVETNLYVAVGLMKLYRLHIDTTMSGSGAIGKIREGKVYDVIFMDHMMPEMDGIETTKQLRSLGYTAPIVALTANAVAGQSDMFLHNGFDAFISKPIDIRQLNSALNRFVRDKQPPEVIAAARRQKANGELNGNGHGAARPQIDPQLLESFIRDAHKVILVLEESGGKSGWFENDEYLQNFTIMAHGIKSSLLNIGKMDLAESAYKLEMAGRARNTDQITTLTPPFLNELRALTEGIEPVRDENGADEDIEGLRTELLTVCEMCAGYNRKDALHIIAGITDCSKETRAVLENLNERILHSDFDEAKTLAAAYADKLSLAPRGTGEIPVSVRIRTLFLSKEVAGLDIAKGLERYDGDGDTYMRVLRSYVSGVSSMLRSMENAGTDSLDDYERAAHSIKGASRGIFAERIASVAESLEEAAEAGDFNRINAYNPAFLVQVRSFISDLEGMIAAVDAENPKPKKDKPESELLSQLLAACRAYNMDGADAAMAKIERYRYTSDDGLADRLRECVDRMDFAQIIEKLTNSIG